jgi:hypothetical protein
MIENGSALLIPLLLISLTVISFYVWNKYIWKRRKESTKKIHGKIYKNFEIFLGLLIFLAVGIYFVSSFLSYSFPNVQIFQDTKEVVINFPSSVFKSKEKKELLDEKIVEAKDANFWEIESKWIGDENINCPTNGILGKYCIKIKKCEELFDQDFENFLQSKLNLDEEEFNRWLPKEKLRCFQKTRNDLGLNEKIITDSIFYRIGVKRDGLEKRRVKFFNGIKDKWGSWETEFKTKMIYSILEAKVYYNEFPEWLKKDPIAKKANESWNK